jgi:methylenetetrahydrofolate reductase (NADPH)
MKNGVTLPVYPGIMLINQYSNLVRFSEMCGAEIPCWMRKRFESYGDDLESIKAFGLEVVHGLCSRLLEGGVSGLHFYTLNRAEESMNVLQMLGLGEQYTSALLKPATKIWSGNEIDN